MAGQQIPAVLFNVGVIPAELLVQAKAGKAHVAGTHTSRFAPEAKPAIQGGVQAMTAAAIDLPQK